MITLKVGDTAPRFSVQDENGVVRTLGEEKGNWVLLYFYPRDNTPGCTVEAQGIRDTFDEFIKLHCTVFGISTDSSASHQKFIEKQSLPFTLLADTDKKMSEHYGVWQPKKFMGKEFLGVVRSSFLINPDGVIVKIYPKVKPALHAQEVLDDLKNFQTG